jgi:hypothetical protein
MRRPLKFQKINRRIAKIAQNLTFFSGTSLNPYCFNLSWTSLELNPVFRNSEVMEFAA